MSAVRWSADGKREQLLQAIVEEIESWPELDRQVFIYAHYVGQRSESISHSMGLEVYKVCQILENCERELRVALRGFRNGARPITEDEQLDPLACALSECLR